MRLAGARIRITYDSGAMIDAVYGDDEVEWAAVAGPAAGSEGREPIYRQEVADGVHFINWLEENGTTVSQVLDLERGRVNTFATFDTPHGRESAWMTGKITIH